MTILASRLHAWALWYGITAVSAGPGQGPSTGWLPLGGEYLTQRDCEQDLVLMWPSILQLFASGGQSSASKTIKWSMPGLILVNAQTKGTKGVTTLAHAFYCFPANVDPRKPTAVVQSPLWVLWLQVVGEPLALGAWPTKDVCERE